ncbi:hypothetical protein B5807_01454 [Epicoccum nigrum]|jgi:hypothetical protein|uniref:DUF7587 domain-containing protein n=1 Tax=Epicoccum nigrum TaxID=105696 RepID=A0A1Y2MD31_EPING|nr:hypothetical protein B5807_01454 [Epicoccum nigrum]
MARAPRKFWRVEDSSSRACYTEGEGILAEATDTAVSFGRQGTALRAQLRRHLDWSNRRRTPFVSVYSDRRAAWREAERRVAAGKRHVVVYKIDVDCSCERVEYRHVQLLAETLRLRIAYRAWNNSKYEWVFLHAVPDSAVVGVAELG